jgi:hypothetical protein
MKKKHLKFVGEDYWGCITFRCVEDGRYLCLVDPLCPRDSRELQKIIEDCAAGQLQLHTKCPSDDFDGEPDYPTKQQFIFKPWEGKEHGKETP